MSHEGADEMNDPTPLQRLLREREQQLRQELRTRMSEIRADRSAPGRDGIEVADDSAGRDLSYAMIQMKSAAVAELEAALRRLDAGNYGDCLECGGPISSQRLRAMPSAVRCQPCAQRIERTGGELSRLRIGA